MGFNGLIYPLLLIIKIMQDFFRFLFIMQGVYLLV